MEQTEHSVWLQVLELLPQLKIKISNRVYFRRDANPLTVQCQTSRKESHHPNMFAFGCTRCEKLWLFSNLTWWNHRQALPWWHCGMCAFADDASIVGCWSESCSCYWEWLLFMQFIHGSEQQRPSNNPVKARMALPPQERSISSPQHLRLMAPVKDPVLQVPCIWHRFSCKQHI